MQPLVSRSHPSTRPSTRYSDPSWPLFVAIILLAVITLFLVLAAFESIRVSDEIRTQLAIAESSRVPLHSAEQLQLDKHREEVVKLRLENARQRLIFSGFLAQLVGISTAMLAIVGIWQASSRYLDARRKERDDRLATAFAALTQGLASSSADEQAVSLIGLQQFLTPDHVDYHERTVALLNLLGRLAEHSISAARIRAEEGLRAAQAKAEQERLLALRSAAVAMLSLVYHLPGEEQKQEWEKVVLSLLDRLPTTSDHDQDRGWTRESEQRLSIALGPVLEYAFRHVHKSILAKYSWQYLSLNRIGLHHLDLAGLDFRHTSLRGCDLAASNLAGAAFNGADLTEAKLDHADLSGANLTACELARASLRNAKLTNANLSKIRFLDTDVTAADFGDAIVEWDAIDWRLTIGWRDANMPEVIKRQIGDDLGTGKGTLTCLMLLWELPPFVTGGGWTAAYHMIRSLRRQGVAVTIASPWMLTEQTRFALGHEITVVPLNVLDFADTDLENAGLLSLDIQYAGSVYGYGFQDGSTAASASEGTREPAVYGTYAINFNLMDRFTQRLVRHFKEEVRQGKKLPEVIHAHDWVTFPAAAALAQLIGRPWIAQFHSTESERSGGAAHPMIAHIEREAARHASRVFAVSQTTADAIKAEADGITSGIRIVPNTLVMRTSWSPRRHTDLKHPIIGYVGRFTWQKGTDRFLSAARLIGRRIPEALFALYGSGPDERSLKQMLREDGMTWTGHAFPGSGWAEAAVDNNQVRRAALNRSTCLPEAISDKQPNPDGLKRRLRVNGFRFVRYDICPSGDYRTLLIAFNRATSEEELYLTTWSPEDDPEFDRQQGAKRFHFGGFVDWFKRDLVYCDLAVLLVPSRYEPFGMIVLEAMEAGVPVICQKSAGVHEWIKSIVGVDFDDPEEVADKVAGLLMDPPAYVATVDRQYEELCSYAEGPQGLKVKAQYDLIETAREELSGS